VVELTTLIGYYTLVSMTLNAHHIPLPDGAAAPLAPCAATRVPPGFGTGLTDIAASRVRAPPERPS
jgi:4-carboxymuconolactone decarboxylase